MIKRKAVLAAVLLAIGQSDPVAAGPVADLTTFTAGTPARADEVNGNFSNVADAVNDNDARIAELEAEIAELREQLSNVLNVDQYLSLETVNDQPAIRVTGANLQLVNGLGETETANGTGNLLIGYDEEREDGLVDEQCSLGTDPNGGTPVTDAQECDEAGGLWALSHKTGSHYLITGTGHNYTRWGGIVVGNTNTSNFDFASVSGGLANTASAAASGVSGGIFNTASGGASSVSGGGNNTASGGSSSVSGGEGNVASGGASSVSGGGSNTASGGQSSISGGGFNTASANNSSVSGGLSGTAGGVYSSVSGGWGNTASGLRSSISGGRGNTASREQSSVSGGNSRSANGIDDWVAGSLFENN